LQQSTTEKADGSEPEFNKRTMMVLKLPEGLGLTEAGIKVFEDTDLIEQQAATSRMGITRMCACCQEILKEKERFLSCQTSVLYF
jgi:hypothetical protein